MKISKQLLLAAAFMLLTGLGATAMAQGKDSLYRVAAVTRDQPVVRISAIEVSFGTAGTNTETSMDTAFGYSFLGQTTGSFPGTFTLSMNSTPSTPIPGGTSEVTGGSWTLPVYEIDGQGNTSYAGSFYGTISSGMIEWDQSGTTAGISFRLNVNGGTEAYDGTNSFATFVGTLLVDEATQKITLEGKLTFNS